MGRWDPWEEGVAWMALWCLDWLEGHVMFCHVPASVVLLRVTSRRIVSSRARSRRVMTDFAHYVHSCRVVSRRVSPRPASIASIA